MRIRNKEHLAMLAALAGNGLWGFSLLFSKVALEVSETFVLLSVRFVTAFLLMNLLLLTRKARLNLRGKPLLPLLLLGLVQPVLYFIGENYGIQFTTSSFAGAMIALTPVVALGAGALFLRERATRLQTASAAVSVGGVILISVTGAREGTVSPVGILLLLLAVGSAVAFTLLSRKTSGQFTSFERTYVMFAVGSVFFTTMAIVVNRGQVVQRYLEPMRLPAFWGAIAYLAGASSVVAFLLVNYSITHLSAARSSIFNNVVTVVSIAAGVVFLHERFTWVQFVGAALVIAGVYGVNRCGSTPTMEAVSGQDDLLQTESDLPGE